eukprot:1265603-Pyramimonas_sp.AAC.1
MVHSTSSPRPYLSLPLWTREVARPPLSSIRTAVPALTQATHIVSRFLGRCGLLASVCYGDRMGPDWSTANGPLPSSARQMPACVGRPPVGAGPSESPTLARCPARRQSPAPPQRPRRGGPNASGWRSVASSSIAGLPVVYGTPRSPPSRIPGGPRCGRSGLRLAGERVRGLLRQVHPLLCQPLDVREVARGREGLLHTLLDLLADFHARRNPHGSLGRLHSLGGGSNREDLAGPSACRRVPVLHARDH